MQIKDNVFRKRNYFADRGTCLITLERIGSVMAHIRTLTTGIGVAAAFAFAASTVVFAQSNEDCNPKPGDETAVGASASEEVADYVEDPGCDVGHLTEEAAMDAEAMDEGSQAPETGVGNTADQ
jgi:hypothetical protein